MSNFAFFTPLRTPHVTASTDEEDSPKDLKKRKSKKIETKEKGHLLPRKELYAEKIKSKSKKAKSNGKLEEGKNSSEDQHSTPGKETKLRLIPSSGLESEESETDSQVERAILKLSQSIGEKHKNRPLESDSESDILPFMVSPKRVKRESRDGNGNAHSLLKTVSDFKAPSPKKKVREFTSPPKKVHRVVTPKKEMKVEMKVPKSHELPESSPEEDESYDKKHSQIMRSPKEESSQKASAHKKEKHVSKSSSDLPEISESSDSEGIVEVPIKSPKRSQKKERMLQSPGKHGSDTKQTPKRKSPVKKPTHDLSELSDSSSESDIDQQDVKNTKRSPSKMSKKIDLVLSDTSSEEEVKKNKRSPSKKSKKSEVVLSDSSSESDVDDEDVKNTKRSPVKKSKKQDVEETASEEVGYKPLEFRKPAAADFEQINFQEETPPIYAEDTMSDNFDLVLITVPFGFEIGNLEGQTLNLDGEDKFEPSKDGLVWKSHSRKLASEEATEFCPLLPSKKTGHLMPVKPFSHQVTFTASYEIPALCDPALPPDLDFETPGGLMYRNVPFGSQFEDRVGEQKKVVKKKKKMRHKEVKENLDDVVVSSKHKKRKRQDSEHHDHNKKQKRHKSEIEGEKKKKKKKKHKK